MRRSAANVSWYALSSHIAVLLSISRSAAMGGVAVRIAELLKASRKFTKQNASRSVWRITAEMLSSVEAESISTLELRTFRSFSEAMAQTDREGSE